MTAPWRPRREPCAPWASLPASTICGAICKRCSPRRRRNTCSPAGSCGSRTGGSMPSPPTAPPTCMPVRRRSVLSPSARRKPCTTTRKRSSSPGPRCWGRTWRPFWARSAATMPASGTGPTTSSPAFHPGTT